MSNRICESFWWPRPLPSYRYIHSNQLISLWPLTIWLLFVRIIPRKFNQFPGFFYCLVISHDCIYVIRRQYHNLYHIVIKEIIAKWQGFSMLIQRCSNWKCAMVEIHTDADIFLDCGAKRVLGKGKLRLLMSTVSAFSVFTSSLFFSLENL